MQSIEGFHVHRSCKITQYFDDTLSGVLVSHKDGFLLPVVPVDELFVDGDRKWVNEFRVMFQNFLETLAIEIARGYVVLLSVNPVKPEI